MPSEHEPIRRKLPFTGIYISLIDRAVEFEDEQGTVARIDFAGETVLIEGEPLLLGTRERISEERSPEMQNERREKQRPTTVSGKLLMQPKEGKIDSRSKPTAWARLAVHEEGRDDAHLYSATFHRHTTAIALGLAKGAPVTVEGYPHVTADHDGKRLDTFSVINVVTYPGKPDKARSRRPAR